MKLKLFLIVTLFLLVNGIVKPQSLKIGFAAEPSLIFRNINNQKSVAFNPYSVNLKLLVIPNRVLNFEVRPGVFYSGDVDYSWIELGGFIRFNILPTKFYFITGVSDHIRGGYDDILYTGAGIGFQKDSISSFDVIFYWKTFKNNEPLTAIIKVDISFTWDIL
jgi:hypothetical protein